MKDVMKEKEVTLPGNVVKKCFLFEAINYIACGCPPMMLDSYSEDEQYTEDFRYSELLYYNGIYGSERDELYTKFHMMSMLSEQYGIETSPYYDEKDEKYEDISFYSSLEAYDKSFAYILKEAKDIPRELLKKHKNERQLLKEYLAKQDRYDSKLEKILKPLRLQLLAKLKNGEIIANGLLIQKYNEDEEGFVDIDGSWRDKVVIRRGYIKNDSFDDFIKCTPKQVIHRESIPKEYWLYNNIDWEESELIFKVAKDTYKYCFILIDFMAVHQLFPKQLEMDVNARLSGSKFLYDDKEYIKLDEINNLREKRYIDEKRKGGQNSYQVYKPLKNKVDELCKEELNKKSYSSANQLCHKVADLIEEKYPELLNSFQPYQSQGSEGNDWKKPTFYGWCNDLFKTYKHIKETASG